MVSANGHCGQQDIVDREWSELHLLLQKASLNLSTEDQSFYHIVTMAWCHGNNPPCSIPYTMYTVLCMHVHACLSHACLLHMYVLAAVSKGISNQILAN